MSQEDLRFSERYQESLQWDEDIYKDIQGKRPDAKYGVISEFMRHAIKDTTQCSLFCGGLKCKYDNPEHWKPEQTEIKGVFSNWITDNIIAISRPSNKAMEEYDIIKQFKESGIKSIINLQTPGEHASCGPPLDPSGFSYNPQTFMDNDIFFYNFGWPDYGVGSLSNILDMVKVTQFAVTEGKIAVHCHAGLGRTGVLIACYLVYANRMDPHEVVHYIRSKRQGAIQTRNQVTTIEEFGAYLKPLRIVYSSVEDNTYSFTLPQYMIRQKHILHGLEAKNLKYIPKIIFVICERLMELARRKSHRKRYQRNSVKVMQETAPAAFNNRRSTTNTNGLKPSTSSSLLDPHTVDSRLSISSSRSMDNLARNFNRLSSSQRLSPGMSQRGTFPISKSGSYSDSDNLSSMDSTDFVANSQDPRFSKKFESHGGQKYTGLKVGVAETVALAMAQSEYEDEVHNKVESLKKELNEDFKTWLKLGEEEDSLVLSKLMWDWLDDLKEPALTVQDLSPMLRHTDNPPEGLLQLEKVTRTTIEYLFGVLTRLQPLSEDTEMEVMQRLLSTLTHRNMCVEYAVNASITSVTSRRTINTGEMDNILLWRMMQFFVKYLTMCKDQQEENRSKESESSNRERAGTSEYDEQTERKGGRRNGRPSREREEPVGGETRGSMENGSLSRGRKYDRQSSSGFDTKKYQQDRTTDSDNYSGSSQDEIPKVRSKNKRSRSPKYD